MIRGMKLADWFNTRKPDGTKRSKKDFAEKIGKAPSTVTAYLNGSWPGQDAMEAIVRETGGEVTPNDFMQAELRPEAAE